MSVRYEKLAASMRERLGGQLLAATVARGELTIEVAPADLLAVARTLRDDEGLSFDELIDLCAVDYSDYGNGRWIGSRYAVVVHLLSVRHNRRLRLRAFCSDDELPRMPSLVEVWSSANWYEREAFDLLGVLFDGHPDLRRILTDYGFVGHPLRKDFPLSGDVEMRYDPEQRRVIYEPVSIETRINQPRVIRDDHRYAERDEGQAHG